MSYQQRNINIKKHIEMKNKYTVNQELTYIGRGFMGFDKNDTKMTFVKTDGNFDLWVKYKGNDLLVGRHEVK